MVYPLNFSTVVIKDRTCSMVDEVIERRPYTAHEFLRRVP